MAPTYSARLRLLDDERLLTAILAGGIALSMAW
jgi:hypothetical protein